MERLLEAHAPQRRISLGLERIHAALDYFGRPDRRYDAVLISGTKGKGSTATFLACSLQAMGIKVGLFTSPHLQCLGERIVINHKMISPGRLRGLLQEIFRAIHLRKVPDLSYFETLAVASALYFAEENVDFAVWEVGIGGRLDATNAFARIGALTTSVSLDHTDILGPTLRHIVSEKIAIHESADVRIIGGQTPAVLRLLPDLLPAHSYWLFGRDFSVMTATADTTGLSLVYYGNQSCCRAKIRQVGMFQAENLATALAFIEKWRSSRIPAEVLSALPSAFWPGRMEIVKCGSSVILLDGAHNPFSVRHLVRNLRLLYPQTRWTVIFSSQATKDYQRMVQSLTGIARKFIFTTAPGAPHPADPEVLSRCSVLPHAVVHFRDLLAELTVPRVSENLLVTGSLYLVGAIRTALNLPPLTPYVGPP